MATIDTPDGIRFFRLLQFRGRLHLEVEAKIKFRDGPTLKMYNQAFGTNFSRKAQALEDVERRIEEAKSRKG